MEGEDDETEQMRCALSAIADEMQKYNSESFEPDDTQIDDDDDTILLKYKNALKLKKEQIKMLKNNLKSACTVARTLSAAKSSEITSLNNQLNSARNQYWDLIQQDKEKSNIINVLKAENQTLQDKLKSFNNFIHLGYQELRNIHNESLEENISSLKKLQTIICCCSQYYANHHNQFEKCAQLEQKNRFLTSKLHILESQLETTVEELCNLRANVKRINQKKDGTPVKNPQCRNIGVLCAEFQISSCSNNKQSFRGSNRGNLDLIRHLSTVRKLLLDQDTLIKDLKCLSKEINTEIFDLNAK